MAQSDKHPVDDEIIRAVFKHLGPTAEGRPQTGMLIGVQPIDRDGFLGEGQAIFVGTEEDLQELGDLTSRLFDKGLCIQAPNWLRALAGMPLEAEDGED